MCPLRSFCCCCCFWKSKNMEVDNQTRVPSSSSSSSPSATTEAASSGQASAEGHQPTCVIILGMAGSGKSSLCSKLVSHLFGKAKPPYVINCDPACLNVDYLCNIDIRDTIHYKNVMQKYGLGPNGSIITSLNLFVTNFDQVLTLVDKRKQDYKYVLLDTPGQVEVFTWSASGSIITEALASKYPTVILFVVDTVRSHNPTTFMSNMLYACSIVYKYKLPMIVVLNKSDVIDPQFAIDWMQNSELFDEAINKDPTYMACLNQSLTMALDIFYQDLPVVGVSAKTGSGFDELMQAIHTAADDYEKNYRPEYERLSREAQLKKMDNLSIEEQAKEVEEEIDADLVTFGVKKSDDFV